MEQLHTAPLHQLTRYADTQTFVAIASDLNVCTPPRLVDISVPGIAPKLSMVKVDIETESDGNGGLKVLLWGYVAIDPNIHCRLVIYNA